MMTHNRKPRRLLAAYVAAREPFEVGAYKNDEEVGQYHIKLIRMNRLAKYGVFNDHTTSYEYPPGDPVHVLRAQVSGTDINKNAWTGIGNYFAFAGDYVFEIAQRDQSIRDYIAAQCELPAERRVILESGLDLLRVGGLAGFVAAVLADDARTKVPKPLAIWHRPV